jgi:hypothetical protein
MIVCPKKPSCQLFLTGSPGSREAENDLFRFFLETFTRYLKPFNYREAGFSEGSGLRLLTPYLRWIEPDDFEPLEEWEEDLEEEEEEEDRDDELDEREEEDELREGLE